MLEDLLKHIARMNREEGKQKQPIGQVSDELRKEYIAWKEQKEEMQAEMEFRMERLKVKLERELEREFKPKFDEYNKEKEELWKRIRAEVGVIGDDDLNIDTDTGVISRWLDRIDFTKH